MKNAKKQMLTRERIEDLIHLRLPETEARRQLTELTPDRVDAEIFAAFLEAMRACGEAVPVPETSVMDCCGTGGSGRPHYNTSTTVAFILAAGGVPVVKFGNRAMSSKSGSFDILEYLGIPAQWDLQRLPEILDACNLVFLYAPQCYPALGRFGQLRREMGIRTIFNFMGPLLNPVYPAYRLLGVSDSKMQRLAADVLAGDGKTRQAWVVYGNGLDEITTDGKTDVLAVRQGSVAKRRLVQVFPGPPQTLDHTPAENAAIFEALVSGADVSSGFHRMVCLNAGAGFSIAGKAGTLEEGMTLAADLLAGGAVRETLDKCRKSYLGKESA